MRDYEEKSYYEIQLDNKQLILVFLAGVTVCVLIFILGVMVGKGKKEAEMAAAGKTERQETAILPQEEAKPPAEIKPTGDEPGSGAAAEEKKKRNKAERGQTEEPKTEGQKYSFYDLDKPDTAQPADAKTPEKQGGSVAAGRTPSREQQPAAASGGADAGTTSPGSPPAEGSQRFTIQVIATSRKTTAEQKLEDLKKKGYSAFMDEYPTTGGSVYKVRVGRFADRASAEKIAARLKQEMKLEPWVAVLE